MLVALMLLGLTGLAMAQKEQVSLGDVVRQQKATKKASHVYTNEEIPSRPEEPATPDTSATPSGGAAPGTDAAAKPTGTVATPGDAKAAGAKDENPEVAAIKGRLKEVTTDELNLNSTIRDIQAHIAQEQDSDRRRVLTNMLENQKKSLALRLEEKSDLQKRLADAQQKKN